MLWSSQLGREPVLLIEARLHSLGLIDVACGGVRADGAQIEGRVNLRRSRLEGRSSFIGARVGGAFECENTDFLNPGGNCLALDGAHIAGTFGLTDGTRAEGVVRLWGTTVGGTITMTGSRLNDPDVALLLDSALITGNVLLGHGFVARGTVSLCNADIGGSVNCQHGLFEHPDAALLLDGATIGRRLYMDDGFRAVGAVSFVHTHAAGFEDERDCWPESMYMDGFEYERLYGQNRSWRSRSEWLRRQVEPSPQPYIELAKVYRATGHERPARKILIERHNALLNPPDHWKPHLPRGIKGLAAKAWRYFLRYTIGHGYEPWRIVWWALPLLVAMSFAYTGARHDNVMKPTGQTDATASACTHDYPCFQPVVYALDTMLPIIDFGQADKWAPDQNRQPGRTLALWTWFTIGAGWVFATLVAASFTQAVRRE